MALGPFKGTTIMIRMVLGMKKMMLRLIFVWQFMFASVLDDYHHRPAKSLWAERRIC